MKGVFTGCQIALDLTTSVKFKEKANLRKSITENGGIVSYIVTKKSTLVVCNDAEKADISYKVKMATKYGIPVVSMAYIDQSVEAGKLLNTDDYLLVGMTKAEELGSGKISASQYQKKEKKKQMKPIYNINSYKSWKADDKNCPGFPRDFQIAKFAVFRAQKKDKNRQYSVFTVLEVHVAEHVEKLDNSDTFKFRVMSHSGSLKSVEQGDKGVIEYRFCSTSEEALFLYTHLYNEKLQAPHNMELVHDMFSRHIGSEKFQQMMSELGLESESVSPPVGELVEHVWREAMGELESIISVPVTSVKSEQVEKAEAILKQIKEALDNNNSTEGLVEEFYSLIPHNKAHRVTSPTKAWLSRKQDLCQLIKDMVSVSEATDWSMRSGTQSKYKALRCTIEHVTSADGVYKTLKNKFLASLVAASREQDSSFEIQNIYAVTRPVENSNFTQDIDNKQFLYHSSRVENFVGILSRGLVLPKVVVDDFGGTRSDPGMLGSGIYFASDPRTSVAYSTASKTKGTRLMLVNEVALGNCLDTTQKDLTLTCAPEGYQSVHGVKATFDQPSDFKNDEYVVYKTEQQRIKYLIEFTVAEDTILELEGIGGLETDLFEDVEYLNQEIDLHDVKNVLDPMSKVKPGLVSTGDTPVDLKGVHIRAKLLDMASEVVVLQEYYNNSVETLEAKYVFPLGDMAAVCGFEAFINGKHIVGEVKEKETAHKEYKKAVSEGHGAYLMDQDEETPDVFTVSVGNLPPGASVLIKITYVAELQVEGELISFRLPGSVAPWKRDTALKDITQHDTDTVEVKQGETTVQVAIEMPFDIRSIECPTNKVRVKKTLTKATVELLENQSIEDGFQLLVGLAEIHVPRMWVERKTGDLDRQACMLSFYPEFEACEDDNVEVVFLFDLSNSMKGDNLRDAKKVLLLTLQHLPAQWQFNVVVFGTAFKELFPSCVAKSPSNLKKATEFIKNLSATMGNTEVIRPMHTFYLLRHESSIQNVFLLSDGHINNEETMLSNAMKHSQHTRIFTMGVSSTANRHLLRALARVGAGAYEFFDSKVKSKWEAKVKLHISKAAQPGLTSVRVDWEQHGAEVPPPAQAPRQITALFSGSRQVVYGYVSNCLMATLRANIAGHEVSTVVSTSYLSITEGQILHRLTARAIISDWEDGVLSPDRTDHEIVKMNTKKFIIELSKEYSIVTQFTSFVAIEKRDKDDVVAADAPTMAELVEWEDVDQLTYMGFEQRKEMDDYELAEGGALHFCANMEGSGYEEGQYEELFSGYEEGQYEEEKKEEKEWASREPLQQLKDMEKVLIKKADFLEKKMESALAEAKKNGVENKTAALQALKRKRRYEKQLQDVDANLSTVEFQREALENACSNTEVLRAMSSASNAVQGQSHRTRVNVDYLHDLMDEELDQQELSTEISEAISSPMGFGVDTEEIEEDLMDLLSIEQQSLELDSIEANVAAAQQTLREGTQELTRGTLCQISFNVLDIEPELMEVKQTMAESLDTVLERGEMLDSLVEKSEALSGESAAFKRASERQPDEQKEDFSDRPLIGRKKDRRQSFNILKPYEQKEDFSDLPPSQQKKKLQKKLDELSREIAYETAERDGMFNMKEVYQYNPALGDPNSPEILKKITENAQKLNDLQAEYRKFQDLDSDIKSVKRSEHSPEPIKKRTLFSEPLMRSPLIPEPQEKKAIVQEERSRVMGAEESESEEEMGFGLPMFPRRMVTFSAEVDKNYAEFDWSNEEEDDAVLERGVQLGRQVERAEAISPECREIMEALKSDIKSVKRSVHSPEPVKKRTLFSEPLMRSSLFPEPQEKKAIVQEEKSRVMSAEESESEEEMGFGLFDDDFGYSKGTKSAEQKRELKDEPPVLTVQSFRDLIPTRLAADARTALEPMVAAPWETTVQAQQSQVPRYTTGGPPAPPPPLISGGGPAPPPPPPVVHAGHIVMAASGGAPSKKLLARLSQGFAQTLSAPVPPPPPAPAAPMAPSPLKTPPVQSKMSFKRIPAAPPPAPGAPAKPLPPAAGGAPPPPPPPPAPAAPMAPSPMKTPPVQSKMSFKRTPAAPPPAPGAPAPPPPPAAGGAPPPPPPPPALKGKIADAQEGPPAKGFKSKSSSPLHLKSALTADMFLKDKAGDKPGAAKQMKEKKEKREVTRGRASQMSLKDAKEESDMSASSVSWRTCELRDTINVYKREARFMKPIPTKRAAKKLVRIEDEHMYGESAKTVSGHTPLIFDVCEAAPQRAMVRELQPLMLGKEPHMEGLGYMQKDFTPKTLDQYGIGTHIPSILRGVPSLSSGSLDKLFELQDKVSGSWTMTTELEKLLGIDFSVCKNLLVGAGLTSLGSRVMEQVLLLVSTFIVLLCILKTLRPELFPIDFSHQQAKFATFYEGFTTLMKLEASQPLQSGSLVDAALLAMAFCGNLDKEYPLIYSTLELGLSWEEVVASMLGIHEAQGSLKKLEDTPAWSLWEKYSFSDFHKELLVK